MERPERFPLTAFLLEALEQLRNNPKSGRDFVFLSRNGKPLKSIRTAFTTACRNASLADVSPHTLRHTFASRLAMSGADLRTLQELGGWKEIKMVERYAHLSDEHKAQAVERIVGFDPQEIPQRFSQHSKKQSA